MATRLRTATYGNINGTYPPLDHQLNGRWPPAHSIWEIHSTNEPCMALTTNAAITYASDPHSGVISGSYDGAPALQDLRALVFVSEPLTAQTISGTLKVMFNAMENSADYNFNTQMTARVMANDGTTLRGVLYGGHNNGSLVNEVSAEMYAPHRFPYHSGSGVTLSSVTCQEGDVIVVEVGFREYATSAGQGFVQTGFHRSNYPDVDVSGVEGDAYVPGAYGWIEFSDDLTFQPQLIEKVSSFGYASLYASAGPTELEFYPTPPAGATLIFYWASSGSATLTSVVGNGATWTRLNRQVATDGQVLELWCGRVANGIPGNTVLTADITPTVTAVQGGAYTGVSQVNPAIVSGAVRSVGNSGSIAGVSVTPDIGDLVLTGANTPHVFYGQTAGTLQQVNLTTPMTGVPLWDTVHAIMHSTTTEFGPAEPGTKLMVAEHDVQTVTAHKADWSRGISGATDLTTRYVPIITAYFPLGTELGGSI